MEGRILALDLGTKRIGLALSDPTQTLAQPLKTWTRKKLGEDLAEIARVATEFEVLKIIVGLPLNMNGSHNPMSKLVLEFQEQLQKKIAIPIETWDERFTTLAAERTLLEGNMRREKRKDVRDQLAAVFILQGWLDAQKRP